MILNLKIPNLQLSICLRKAPTLANSTWLCLSQFPIQPTETSLPTNIMHSNIEKEKV